MLVVEEVARRSCSGRLPDWRQSAFRYKGVWDQKILRDEPHLLAPGRGRHAVTDIPDHGEVVRDK